MEKTLQIQIPKGFKIEDFDINSGIVKFTTESIIERIKSIDDAINELGEEDEEVKLLRFLEPIIGEETHVYGHQEAVVIAKSLNEGWVADFSNSYQPKYEARFYYDSFTVGFVYFACNFCTTTSSVGSSLCFPTSEIGKYFGTQFIDIYRKYL